MKEIVSKAGGDAKLRLRGKGSGYTERDSNTESNEPLQLCISSPSHEGYIIARRCVEELLLQVYGEYDKWCAEQGLPHRSPGIHMTERHHEGAGGGRPHDGRGNSRGARRGGGGKARRSSPPRDKDFGFNSADRGTPPPGAPLEQEIEAQINARNEARKGGDFAKADSIRDDLKRRGVMLSDEKGGRGGAPTVTAWRYWHD